MARTASDHHGTGAVTTTHGTGTHGHITALGDSTDGIIIAPGIMTLGIMGDSTTLGTMEGSTEDGILGSGTTTTHTIADGMVVWAGTHTIMDISTAMVIIIQATTRLISEGHPARTTIAANATRQVLKDFLQAAEALLEADRE